MVNPQLPDANNNNKSNNETTSKKLPPLPPIAQSPSKTINPYATSRSYRFDREKGVQVPLRHSSPMKKNPAVTSKTSEDAAVNLNHDLNQAMYATHNKEFQPMDYKTNSTKSNYAKAKRSYNNFATKQKILLYAQLTLYFLETYDVVRLFKEFAEYLFSNYEAMVAPNYLSCVKVSLEKDFPTLKFFQRNQYDQAGKLAWYSKIYNQLLNKGVDHNHEEGKDVTKGKAPVLRALLNDIILTLLNENTAKSVFEGVQMTMVRSSVGRPNELALCTWNGMFFNGKEVSLQWKRSKSHSETPMTLPPDVELMALCPLHSLGRYILTYGGSYQMVGQAEEDIRWLFPQLKNTGDTYITDKLTKTIHRLAEKGTIDGLTKNHTAYGIKAGALNDMTYEDTSLNEQNITNRSHWTAKNKRTLKNLAGSNHKHYVQNVSTNRDLSHAGKVKIVHIKNISSLMYLLIYFLFLK